MTNTQNINNLVQSLIEAADNFEILPIWHYDETDHVFAHATKIYSNINSHYITVEMYIGKIHHNSEYCVTGGDNFAEAYKSFLEMIDCIVPNMHRIK